MASRYFIYLVLCAVYTVHIQFLVSYTTRPVSRASFASPAQSGAFA